VSVLHAIILGIIQGLTEAFPISSSAHLVIFPWFFNWKYQGLSFDVALHSGTALAFIIYFWKDWMGIVASAFSKNNERRSNLLWYIVVGTIPAAAAVLILEKKIETVFRSPLIIAGMLAVFAIILWLADDYGKKQKSIGQVNMRTALAIGLAQILALFPGVSRSGITITAGLVKGFSRQTAARFSFLLATPIVVAAAALKLPKLLSSDLTFAFWMGVLFSAASGFIGIHFLLGFVKKSSFKLFVLYRIVLAVIILVVFFLKK
jgi:undecaprenyl-diphosphatase